MSGETTPPPDCAANGAATISRTNGLIDDEMRECSECGAQCRWDMTEHSFFGFPASCPNINPPEKP